MTTICLAALGCNGVFGIENFGLKLPASGDSGAAEDAELDEDSRSPIDAGPDAGELTGITATSPPTTSSSPRIFRGRTLRSGRRCRCKWLP